MPAPVDPTATVPNPNSGVYYEDRTATLYGGTIALQTLATLFVILRFISRKVSKNGFWWDDWMILPAMVWDFPFPRCPLHPQKRPIPSVTVTV